MAEPKKYGEFILVEFSRLSDSNQKAEIGKLSTLVGDRSIQNEPLKSDRQFRARVFSDLYSKLPPDSGYPLEFITALVIPSLVDEFETLPPIQDQLLDKLRELIGDVSNIDMNPDGDEDEDEFNLRLYSEQLLNLPNESLYEMALFARSTAQGHQQGVQYHPVKQLSASGQPPGFNPALVRTPGNQAPPQPPQPPPKE